MDARLAEFEFKNLVGDIPKYNGINYLWMVYSSKPTNQHRGKIETKDEITQFLKTTEFDLVEFYVMENGRQSSTPVATLQKHGDMTQVFYDEFQLRGWGLNPSYWFGCFPGWSIDQLISLSAGVDKIIDDFNIQRTLQKFRALQKSAFPN